MKKFAVIALSLSLVSTAASAVVIDVTTEGVTRRINCGKESNLLASALSQADKDSCGAFFRTAAQAGGGAGAGGAGAAGAGAGAGAGAAGAFGLGAAGTFALAALGIALVAGFGGSSNTTTN